MKHTLFVHILSRLIFFLPSEHCWNSQNLKRMKNKTALKNIMSAKSCGDECRKRSSCTSWAWHHKGAGAKAYICNLGEGGATTTQDPNVFSGDQECLQHSKYNCETLRACHQPLL